MTKIGVTLPQFTDDPTRFVSGVERAEALGFDSVWLFDHLWPLGENRQRPILECWTALAYVAGATSHAEIGTLVTRSSLRNPAILSKMAATVGAIAPERLIVAIGSGDHLNEAENEAFGLPFYRGDDRIAQLVSCVTAVSRMLNGESVTLHDDYADISSLPSSPRTAPPPQVWIGGRSVEVLEVAARIAGGWNGWGADLATFSDDARRIGAIVGTRPFEISWAGQVVLGHDDADARQRLGDRDPDSYVVGGPETVRAALTDAVTAGATHLIVALPDAGKPGSYERFAEVVAPLKGS